jgi:predicted dehydrogenase
MAMGYDELKVSEARRFLRSIESGSPVGATIWDSVATAQLIEAITESVSSGSWQRLQAGD